MLSNYWRFTRKAASNRYDLIHINPSFNRNSFFRDAVFCMLAVLCQKKFLIFFRGWSDNLENKVRYSSLYRTIFNYSYKRCKHFIVLGNRFKSKLEGLGIDQSQFWLETTVADSSYLPEFSLDEKFESFDRDEINILFISRIIEEKGIYIALDAFRILKEENPNRKLNLIVAWRWQRISSGPAVRPG